MKVLDQSGVKPAQIAGIGIDGQSRSAVAADGEGKVLTDTPIWMDTRAQSICDRINKEIGAENIFRLCGNMLQPSYTTAKILWYKENMRKVYEIYKKNPLYLPTFHIILIKVFSVHELGWESAAGEESGFMSISQSIWCGRFRDAVRRFFMRVIAGSARRLQLKTLEGLETRPTTDRIKETLFNMIRDRLVQSQFLDCFAGSGGIGIEALSRGAAKAVFIEKNPRAVECIRQNLRTTHLEDAALVMSCDAVTGLRRLEGKGYCFDTVFMDPPYNHEYERQVLECLSVSGLVHEETVMIVEASLETDFSYVPELGFEVVRNKKYKTNKHVFLRKQGSV